MTKKILDRILALLAEEPAAMLPAKIGALRAAIEIIAADASCPAPRKQEGPPNRDVHILCLSAEETVHAAISAARESARGAALSPSSQTQPEQPVNRSQVPVYPEGE